MRPTLYEQYLEEKVASLEEHIKSLMERMDDLLKEKNRFHADLSANEIVDRPVSITEYHIPLVGTGYEAIGDDGLLRFHVLVQDPVTHRTLYYADCPVDIHFPNSRSAQLRTALRVIEGMFHRVANELSYELQKEREEE